ncbi:E4 orf6/7 [Simian adenovirus A1258]|uniref:ORF6/7 n=2 Tax=Simian mastadenovirus B TaxID=1962299 RepID=A0A0M4MET0_9ADEN|nr:ORF6/7 [Simian adenovirus 8]AFD21992.1 E4 orf6/7 [Simian adenovirus A1258]ALE30308.1 ORF6/7 [Simian adenovirus 8]
MQRERRFRYRLGPYARHQLPPCEQPCTAAVMDESQLSMDCDNFRMHNPPWQLLEGEPDLQDCSQGFVSITDPRLATTEQVWILTPERSGLCSARLQTYTMTSGERVVYRVKWRGGGSLTARVI